jgi:hypothetical protein
MLNSGTPYQKCTRQGKFLTFRPKTERNVCGCSHNAMRRRLLHIKQFSQAELFALFPEKPMDRVHIPPDD